MSTAARFTKYLAGARAVTPLAVVIGVLGLLLGFLSRRAGLSVLGAIVLSGTTFAGSPQVVALSLFADGASVVVAGVAAVCVALRFGLMGLTTASELGATRWTRVVLGQLVVDESWAVSYAGNGRFDRERLIGAGLLVYVVNVGSTAIGAASGSLIADPRTCGLDAAFPALFVMLLWPHLAARQARLTALVAAAITLLLTPIAPPGIPIAVAAVGATVVRAPA